MSISVAIIDMHLSVSPYFCHVASTRAGAGQDTQPSASLMQAWPRRVYLDATA